MFSSTFPIYLFEQNTEEIPDPDQQAEPEPSPSPAKSSEEKDKDEDEAVVEDVPSEDEEKKEAPPIKMKTVTVDNWAQLNSQPPVWTRDPKNITDGRFLLSFLLHLTEYPGHRRGIYSFL